MGRFVARGERPIKPGDSWFSAKSILVECFFFFFKGRVQDELGGQGTYRIYPNYEF